MFQPGMTTVSGTATLLCHSCVRVRPVFALSFHPLLVSIIVHLPPEDFRVIDYRDLFV